MKPKTKRKNKMKSRNNPVLGSSPLVRHAAAARIAGEMLKKAGLGKEIIERAIEEERVKAVKASINRYLTNAQ